VVAETNLPDRTTEYARDVAEGRIVAGRLVRLACERHLRDLARAEAQDPDFPYYFDTEEATLTFRFFEEVLCLNGGDFEGKPFILQPFQAFILGSLHGWKGLDGFRRFRMAYIEQGKGSGKSPLAAGIGLKGMVYDGESRAEVYSAATKKDQASILFRDAVAMVQQSPSLRKKIIPTGAPGREWNLAHLASGSFFRPIASDDGQSGPRPHVALIDEVHEHKSGFVIDMMRAGTKGRRQALIVEITNSGHDRTTVCYQHHTYSAQILEGVLENEAWFAYVCQLDPCDKCRAEGQTQPVEGCPDCDDWRDERVWLKANPNLGVTIQPKYLREQVEEAKGMPTKESVVKRLNFCLWTEAAVHAIPMDRWDACARPIDRAALRDRDCYGGLDIGATSDFTAFTLLFPHSDEETVEVPADPSNPEGEKRLVLRRSYTLLPFFWLPQHPVRRDERMGAVIDAWTRQGFIKRTPGAVVDYDLVLKDILTLDDEFGIQEVAFDRGFQGAQFGTNLLNHFGEQKVFTIPQGIISMNAPFREFIELVVTGRMHHDGNPVMRWMCANCAAETRGGLMKPSKDKSAEKIDGVTAASMSLARAMLKQDGWYVRGSLRD
jgi:phage terminase large subunit-like protein